MDELLFLGSDESDSSTDLDEYDTAEEDLEHSDSFVSFDDALSGGPDTDDYPDINFIDEDNNNKIIESSISAEQQSTVNTFETPGSFQEKVTFFEGHGAKIEENHENNINLENKESIQSNIGDDETGGQLDSGGQLETAHKETGSDEIDIQEIQEASPIQLVDSVKNITESLSLEQTDQCSNSKQTKCDDDAIQLLNDQVDFLQKLAFFEDSEVQTRYNPEVHTDDGNKKRNRLSVCESSEGEMGHTLEDHNDYKKGSQKACDVVNTQFETKKHLTKQEENKIPIVTFIEKKQNILEESEILANVFTVPGVEESQLFPCLEKADLVEKSEKSVHPENGEKPLGVQKGFQEKLAYFESYKADSTKELDKHPTTGTLEIYEDDDVIFKCESTGNDESKLIIGEVDGSDRNMVIQVDSNGNESTTSQKKTISLSEADHEMLEISVEEPDKHIQNGSLFQFATTKESLSDKDSEIENVFVKPTRDFRTKLDFFESHWTTGTNENEGVILKNESMDVNESNSIIGEFDGSDKNMVIEIGTNENKSTSFLNKTSSLSEADREAMKISVNQPDKENKENLNDKKDIEIENLFEEPRDFRTKLEFFESHWTESMKRRKRNENERLSKDNNVESSDSHQKRSSTAASDDSSDETEITAADESSYEDLLESLLETDKFKSNSRKSSTGSEGFDEDTKTHHVGHKPDKVNTEKVIVRDINRVDNVTGKESFHNGNMNEVPSIDSVNTMILDSDAHTHVGSPSTVQPSLNENGIDPILRQVELGVTHLNKISHQKHLFCAKMAYTADRTESVNKRKHEMNDYSDDIKVTCTNYDDSGSKRNQNTVCLLPLKTETQSDNASEIVINRQSSVIKENHLTEMPFTDYSDSEILNDINVSQGIIKSDVSKEVHTIEDPVVRCVYLGIASLLEGSHFKNLKCAKIVNPNVNKKSDDKQSVIASETIMLTSPAGDVSMIDSEAIDDVRMSGSGAVGDVRMIDSEAIDDVRMSGSAAVGDVRMRESEKIRGHDLKIKDLLYNTNVTTKEEIVIPGVSDSGLLSANISKQHNSNKLHVNENEHDDSSLERRTRTRTKSGGSRKRVSRRNAIVSDYSKNIENLRHSFTEKDDQETNGRTMEAGVEISKRNLAKDSVTGPIIQTVEIGTANLYEIPHLKYLHCAKIVSPS